MELNDVKSLIENGSNRLSRVSLYDIGQLRQMTNVDFIIDRESGDYHYEVSIDGINETEAAKKILSNYAWKLDDKNNLTINL